VKLGRKKEGTLEIHDSRVVIGRGGKKGGKKKEEQLVLGGPNRKRKRKRVSQVLNGRDMLRSQEKGREKSGKTFLLRGIRGGGKGSASG